MRRRHHYRRRGAEQAELDMTTFLNLMVVLVPFLLITAVFSRITVVELSLPSAADGAAAAEPAVRVEVTVRESGLMLADNDAVIAKIPKVDGAYDLDELLEHVVALKRRYPDHDSASVLLEPDIEYDHLIQVMDVVRSAEIPVDGQPEFTRVALFTDISIGDAP
ncbi:MAG: biopolymer transporter ExbD [Myxococcales bacterium]|nr:biopolymer transporter ExbD [Myxococcales bacterium]